MEIDIILSPKQAQDFHDRINTDGTDAHAIDEALAHVRSEDAEASVPADLDAIRALIQQYSGGFGTLDDTVRQYLRRWFVSQGGVKVVARVRWSATSNSTQISKVERVPRQAQECNLYSALRARGMGRGTGDCWGRFQRCRGYLLVMTTLVGGAEGSDAVW